MQAGQVHSIETAAAEPAGECLQTQGTPNAEESTTAPRKDVGAPLVQTASQAPAPCDVSEDEK